MYTEGKTLVAQALSTIKGATISASYNIAMKQFPSILYAEVVNVPISKGKEARTQLAYSIDIYSEKSTTELACAVDDALTGLGLKRGHCADLDDPSGLRHKNMKYTGVYDANTKLIYQE